MPAEDIEADFPNLCNAYAITSACVSTSALTARVYYFLETARQSPAHKTRLTVKAWKRFTQYHALGHTNLCK